MTNLSVPYHTLHHARNDYLLSHRGSPMGQSGRVLDWGCVGGSCSATAGLRCADRCSRLSRRYCGLSPHALRRASSNFRDAFSSVTTAVSSTASFCTSMPRGRRSRRFAGVRGHCPLFAGVRGRFPFCARLPKLCLPHPAAASRAASIIPSLPEHRVHRRLRCLRPLHVRRRRPTQPRQKFHDCWRHDS